MSQRKALLLLCSCVFLIFFGCKKDTADTVTTRAWKPALVDKNVSTNPSGRIVYYAVQNCEKDDTYQFNSDDNLVINRGADKCSSSEITIETFKYTKDISKNELIINGVKFTLVEEASNQIKYYAPLASSTGYNWIIYLLE